MRLSVISTPISNSTSQTLCCCFIFLELAEIKSQLSTTLAQFLSINHQHLHYLNHNLSLLRLRHQHPVHNRAFLFAVLLTPTRTVTGLDSRTINLASSTQILLRHLFSNRHRQLIIHNLAFRFAALLTPTPMAMDLDSRTIDLVS